MLRISRQTDYALVLLTRFVEEEGAPPRNARDLAEATGIPLPTVSKVLKSLCRNGLLASTRGVNGGYRLAASADVISVAQVIAAIDGPIALTECLTQEVDPCGIRSGCPTHDRWAEINAAVARALEGLSLRRLSGQRLLQVALLPPAGQEAR
jgi:FeS assembly SUF system regulator